MLKKALLCAAFLSTLLRANAQNWEHLKLDLSMGFPVFTDSENLGLLFHVEPKLKVYHRLFIGMRIGLAINTQSRVVEDTTQFYIDDRFDHGFLSVIPTIDYYWHKKGFRPFVGFGIGPYSLANSVDVSRRIISNPLERIIEIELDYRIGILMRGGLEVGRARFGFEYNFVPTADMALSDGQKIGTVNHSYLGLTLGYVLGKKA